MSGEAVARTPLTYYGGKQRLAPRIVSMLPAHRNYVEPYAGGLAVLFAKPPSEREVVNDLDGDVVNFWTVLRERPDELAAVVAATPYARSEWMDSALAALHPVERARRFLVNVDQSYGRTRQSFSPPTLGVGRGRWQPTTWRNLPERITASAERLKNVAIENRDAVKVIAASDTPNTVLYCDPPYTGPHRSEPNKGYTEDHANCWPEMVEALLNLEHAAAVVSGYPCAASEKLEAAGYVRHEMTGYDNSVGNRAGRSRRKVPEMLWTSPNASPLILATPERTDTHAE